MSSTTDELTGELSREPCPVDICEGDRVRYQDPSLPMGCSEMECTGECGAFSSFDGRRRRSGSAMRVKYDVPEAGYKDAHVCATDECDEDVPGEYGYDADEIPHSTPDDVIHVTFHSCLECDTHFQVGETVTGDRRVLEADADE